MLGRILMSSSGLYFVLGSFIADFNTTHVYNPRWPPHAKFHNGQTMSSAIVYAAATIYYSFKTNAGPAAESESLFAAALFGSMYAVTGLSAILYPGAKGMDPEFGDAWLPQLPIFAPALVANWLGYWLEKSALLAKVK